MWKSIVWLVTSKYGKIISVIAWVVIPVTLTISSAIGISPSLADVSSNNQDDFLPIGAESKKALEFQQQYFPTSGTPGMLVYFREGGLNDKDLLEIESDYSWLLDRALESQVLSEVSTYFDNHELKDSVLSLDNSTLLILLSFKGSDDLTVDNLQEEIRIIRSRLVEPRQEDLQVWLTGPAGVLEDAVSVFQSIDFTITLTSVLLVLVILLSIYRLAIILAILPIISAGLAYLAASNIVALLANRTDLVVNAQATSIMVVLIFGSGTDYMLFISSRFREQLRSGKTVSQAISNTMVKVGPAIFSSATTTILAMLVLGLASLRSYQILGPILAIGMIFAIIAGLTFIPAILSILGRFAYWPSRIVVEPVRILDINHDSPEIGVWYRIAELLNRRPAVIALVSVCILSIMSIGVLQLKPSYDLLGSLPEDTESVEGFKVLQKSFASGTGDPTNVFIVTSNNPIKSFDKIESLTKQLSEIKGVSQIWGPTRPFGIELNNSPNEYAAIIATLSPELRASIWADGPKSLSILVAQGDLQHNQIKLNTSIVETHSYISAEENIVKLDVVFEDDPGATKTLENIAVLRHEIKGFLDEELTTIMVGGQTALQYDTKVAGDRDRIVIIPIVLVIIFFVLVLLVKAIVIPLYLLGTVLLSFLASLGLSVFIFQFVLGHDGIGSGVPVFMFIFLVALGIDYNIYIISRVREESQNLDIRKATIVSVAKTGGVITSAGIILAGTFAALTTLPLRDLFQLGFVVSLGVLLDTFWVRAIIVPSLVILLGKWNWWPSKTAMKRTEEMSALHPE